MSEFAQDYEQKTRLLAEIRDLESRLADVMRAGDMEHARMASLIGATTDMLNVLATLRYPDESTLWRLGGSPLENAYQGLKRSAAAVRPQADRFLANMAELIRANNEVAQLNADYLIALDASYRALMSYAHGNSAPDLAAEVAATVLAVMKQARKERMNEITDISRRGTWLIVRCFGDEARRVRLWEENANAVWVLTDERYRRKAEGRHVDGPYVGFRWSAVFVDDPEFFEGYGQNGQYDEFWSHLKPFLPLPSSSAPA